MSKEETPEVKPKDNEDITKMEEKIKELELEKANLVDEIKNDRTKRQELTEQIEELQKKIDDKPETPPVDNPNNPVDVTETVKKVLSEIESSKAKDNEKKAFEQFINDNKTYSQDNDPSGLKAEALRKQLSRFNTAGLSSQEDFISVIKDADRLLRQGDDNPVKTVDNPEDASLPSGGGDTPPENPNNLSDKEKELIKRNGMSEEKFLKLKESQPGMIQDLLEQM